MLDFLKTLMFSQDKQMDKKKYLQLIQVVKSTIAKKNLYN